MANFSFNRVILGGRLTSQPELKTTQSGTNVTTFTVAVNRKKGKEGDQQSDFINCVAFKERAELICRYFGKGSSICVVGEIQTRKWQDSNGNNRYATEVIVNELHFVDSKSDTPTAKENTAYMPDAYKTEPRLNFEDVDEDSDIPF